mgnify:CR=1 FL=1
MGEINKHLDEYKQKLRITGYNLNPFTSGKITKEQGEYIWKDGYSNSRDPDIAVTLGADEKVRDLLEGSEEETPSLEKKSRETTRHHL